MVFNPGISIESTEKPLGFVYGEGVTGPVVETRTLDSIRGSLMDPACDGPESVYAIAMDVAREEDVEDLKERMLLYGIVTYAKGHLGKEPIRSQGHIHAVSPSCHASTCEVYEIWEGKACIYMQESGQDAPGNCYAVYGKPGDVIIVPPGWVHATINARPDQAMSFGAWCVRDYGFDYVDVRRHGGIAFFPVFEGEKLTWVHNDRYQGGTLIEKNARTYPELGIEPDKPIYTQYTEDLSRFDFVPNPALVQEIWGNYRP